ncbi:MAG TPA: MauE/DoxX family redox-associated membrane protein [Actinomycetota bacterium]
MAESITPVVYGGRSRWVGALVVHALGATLAAAVFGAVLGAIGALLGAPFGRAGLVLVSAIAVVYAVGTLPHVSVAVPQLRRQVPDWWRTFFSPHVTAFLYGAGLGIGFLTFLTGGALVVVSVAAVASGSPWVGVLLLAPFGLVRGLSAIVAGNVTTDEAGPRLVDRLVARPDRWRRVAIGGVLVVVAVLSITAATGSSDGWAALAVATLAVTFAWAAAAKVMGARRWRGVVAAHRLPTAAERLAFRGVPAVEALVPILAIAGYRVAASAWALVLVAGFAVETVRVRTVLGPDVPCGCFGGRVERGTGWLLARDAGLAALAVVGVAAGVDEPLLRWPGAPGPGEILPMVLATVGIAVGAFAAWQAAVWLGKGRA